MNDLIKLYLPNLVMVVGVLVGMQVLFTGPAERRAQERFNRLMQSFDRLDARFDRLDARFDEGFDRIDRLEGTMNTGFDRIFERFDRLERRLRRQIDGRETDPGITRGPVDSEQERPAAAIGP